MTVPFRYGQWRVEENPVEQIAQLAETAAVLTCGFPVYQTEPLKIGLIPVGVLASGYGLCCTDTECRSRCRR